MNRHATLRKSLGLAGLAGVAVLAEAATPAMAQSVEDFYRGKQIQFIAASTPASAYDNWARLLIQFLPKYIPGNPAFVVVNMPGAGHIRGTNYLYAAAPKDGTTIGIISSAIPMAAVVKNTPGLTVEFGQFGLLGSPERPNYICFVRRGASVQSAKELFSKELVVGGAGAGGGISGVPTFLHAILGMKFNIVEGYKSGEEVMLAMERNEVDGMCQTYQSVMLRRSEKFADGSFKLLFNVEERPIPGTSAPSLHSVVESEQQRRMLTFYSLRTELGRPIISPPGVPQERFSALRNAFDRVWKDPEFVAEANKRRLSLDSVSGAELDRLFQILVTSPPEIVERVSKVSRVRLKLKTRCC